MQTQISKNRGLCWSKYMMVTTGLALSALVGCEQDSAGPSLTTEMSDSGMSLDVTSEDMTNEADQRDMTTDQATSELDMSADMELPTDMEVILDMEPPPPVIDASIPGIDPEFVMNEVQLLPSSEGFDLDGDGMVNNALSLLFEDEVVGSVLGGDPNEYIARTVRRGELLLLLDFYQLHDFSDDPSFDIDIYLGRDTDDRRRNNFNGSGAFFVSCSSLNEAGEAGSRFTEVELVNGELSGRRGQFRFLISFAGDTEVVLRDAKLSGKVSPDGEQITEGLLAGAVTFEELEEVVRNDPEIGSGFAQVMLNFLSSKLDMDLDQDGRADALSASFRFTAVRANIDRTTRCAE